MASISARVTALLLLCAALTTLTGCLGMFYGMRTRQILAEEKDLPRNPDTGILAGGEPFFLPGKDRVKAALLVHGFADTPYDMRPVGEYLASRGIASCAPLLAGHGTSVRDMEKTAWPDWVKPAEDAYKELASRYDKVYIVGFSMGGNIAVHLASKYDTAGIALLAPSIFMLERGRPVTTEAAIRDLSHFVMTDYIINNEEDAAYDMSAVKGRVVYTLFPVPCLRSLVNFMELTRFELPKVDEPVLVIQSVNDDTVDISGPGYVLDHISSADKKAVWVERSRHLITLDLEKSSVFRETYEFIDTH